MFCPSCGAESVRGLSYCKVCGASLSGAAGAITSSLPAPSGSVPPAFIFLFAVTALAGLLGLVGVFATLKGLRYAGLPPDMLVKALGLVTIFGGLSVCGVVYLLTNLLWRVFGHSRMAGPRSEPVGIGPGPRPLAQVAPSHVAPSVTEHTTRNFDLGLRD
jgi:hypothetical protein